MQQQEGDLPSYGLTSSAGLMIGESGTWHCLYLCHATATAFASTSASFCPMLLLELVLFLCDATAAASQAHGIATATTCASRTHYD